MYLYYVDKIKKKLEISKLEQNSQKTFLGPVIFLPCINYEVLVLNGYLTYRRVNYTWIKTTNCPRFGILKFEI